MQAEREHVTQVFDQVREEIRQCRDELESSQSERAASLEKYYALKVKLDHLEEVFGKSLDQEKLEWAGRLQAEREHVAHQIQTEAKRNGRIVEREWATIRDRLDNEKKLWESRMELERDHIANELRALTEQVHRGILQHDDHLTKVLKEEAKQKQQEANDQIGAVQKKVSLQLTEYKNIIQKETQKERDNRNATLDRRDKKWFQSFRRVLSEEEENELFNVWNERLGTTIQRSHIRYLQHKVSAIEDQCIGRLASSVQQALLNLFVVRSVKSERLNYLEIGTLFGVNSIITHQIATRWFKHVHLTMIDPLEGYYGENNPDPTSGMPVNQATLVKNMGIAGVPPRDYKIIMHNSNDAKAVAEAGQKQYDVIYVDGDHSYEVVKSDFEIYSPMLKSGGYMIFDDYGDPSWPDVAQCVNECVRPLPDFRCVGDAWHTAVFLKK